MRWLAVVALLGGCDKLFDLQPVPTTDTTRMPRMRPITVAPSTTAPLADFPVSIVIAADADLAANALPDGTDIYFTDPAGTALPHELVAYADGTLEAWVRVTLAGQTAIELHYGEEARSADPRQAWPDLYEAVWHESEASDTAFDSTARDHDLVVPAGMPEPTPIDGPVGRARAFVQSSDETILQQLCAPTFDVINFGTASFSYEVWMKAGALVGTFDQPFEAGGYTTGVNGFALEISSRLAANLSDTSAHVEIDVNALPIGSWAHVAVVVDRAQARLRTYVNGLQSNDAPISTITGDVRNGTPICLGGHDGYDGIVDEARIYRQPLSAEWIHAEYENVANRDQFVTVAAPP